MKATQNVKTLVVTPAPVRRRVRDQHRGPQAHPQRLASPAGRPVQPKAPGGHGLPVEFAGATTGRRRADVHSSDVQLTDRGIALVVGLLALIVVATVFVGVTRFLSISDAPLDEAPVQGVSAVVQA